MPTKWPKPVIINKKRELYWISCSNWPNCENKSEKKEKYSEFAKKKKQTLNHSGNSDTTSTWCTWTGLQKIGIRIRTVGNRRKNPDHPDYSIIVFGENTQKYPGDLYRLSHSLTPVKAHQVNLEWKNRK